MNSVSVGFVNSLIGSKDFGILNWDRARLSVIACNQG